MKYKVVLLTLVLLAVGLTTVYAGSDRRIGTAGAQELLIPIGSRGTAMGGAVIADSYGLEAVYWNPAGLASLEGTEAMFSHLPYIADINVNFGGVGTTIEGFGTVAAAAKVVDIGDIEETTEDDPEGTGSIHSPTLAVVGVTYARNLTAQVQFGATANFISERIFDVSASGVAFDFGVTYTPNWRGITLGIVMKNYGPDMKFSGSGFQRTYEVAGQRRVFLSPAPFELPANISIGMSWNFLNQGYSSATLGGNFRSNNHSNDFWQGGVEYAYNERYFLRGGYVYSEQTDFIYGASFGGGVMFEFGETQLTIEYAWTETETFDDNQYFTVRFGF
ncbi:MAG: PorV/PorQ family protein [Candidatus Zixiibacteriota bacterium]|nr:MAG: PorV/PorQ family protein [candidate division Zixibacteria bacterium]